MTLYFIQFVIGRRHYSVAAAKTIYFLTVYNQLTSQLKVILYEATYTIYECNHTYKSTLPMDTF